ncbi:MAG TPA: type III-B CRISPR module-associated protein Cmr5 [Desulfobulbaceae bacterium]|nr:type III-B CRISPR module-associated protein Cmr5 [Desulfobulbaceae bacterium]
MQTKEQQRAAFALECVERVFCNSMDKDTANFVVGVPTMILTNGLGQTLAFLLSKQKPGEDNKHTKTFKTIKAWLERQGIDKLNPDDENLVFLKKFADLKQRNYLRAQQEALAMLQWLKRYVRAFGEGED